MQTGHWLPASPLQVQPQRAPGVDLWWCVGAAITPQARRDYLDQLLRRVLAAYVGTAPDSLRFGRESRGRPFLLDRNGQPRGPYFNLSDSAGHSLIAVSSSARIGVDLEHGDRRLRHRQLATRYYAADEAAALARLDDDAARRHFLALWTAKEASCKATGTGISGQLHQWRFAVGLGDPRVLSMPQDAGVADEWQHTRLTPSDGFTAVLASRGKMGELRRFCLLA